MMREEDGWASRQIEKKKSQVKKLNHFFQESSRFDRGRISTVRSHQLRPRAPSEAVARVTSTRVESIAAHLKGIQKLAMGDAEPPRSYVTEVVVPTSVPEPFDFGDDAFSFGAGDDGIARVLDDPGYLLGVERNAGKASKAAPTAFANSRHAGYRGPSEATEAAKAAQQAVADELDLLADGREPFFAEEESLGVLIGTIGGSRPSKLVAAAKAIELDAKAARRATEMKRYGRGARPGTAFGSSSSRHKQASLPKSIYSQDVLVRTQKKVERELRETNARAPFITAQYGVKLPAPVSAMQIGDASAKARARRAALSAAKSVQHQRPFSAGPLRSFDRDESFREPTLGVWRVNANVRHDVTDPISVSFQDAKRARAVAALRAKEERDRRDPNGFRPPRVDRSKYPSLKTFLGAQQQRTREVREQMPGYVDAARVAAAKTREADYSRKAKETSGVLLSPGETQELSYGQTVNAVAGNAPVDTENAPALRAFIQLTETFRSGSLSADAGDMERALMVAAADAAKEAVELAAAAAAKTALAAADDDQDAVALIAEGIAEAVYEDTQMLKQVEGVVTPTRHTVPGAFILGQNPRGSPRSLFGPAAFSGGEKHEVPGAKKNIQEPFLTADEQVVQQLAAMTPEQRNAARAKASKGWSGDFTGVFYEQAGAALPTWNEKPAVSEPSPSVGGDAEAFDKSLDATDGDVDALAVTFIGPNAAELAFRAVHPDAPKEVTEEAAQKRRDEMKNAYKSPNELAAAEAAQKACEGLDPTDPATVQDVKQVRPWAFPKSRQRLFAECPE